MTFWLILAVNSIALGGLLFLLSAGFSLIFGLMRIPNLMHGSFFMLGAYFGVRCSTAGLIFWLAALLAARLGVARARRARSSASCCAGWPATSCRRCCSRSASPSSSATSA